MSTALITPDVEFGGLRRKRFTREEVERGLETGYFGSDRFELLDGDLIEKMGQKPAHAWVVQTIALWLTGLFPGRLVRVQLPINLLGSDGMYNIPEPDVAVLRSENPEFTTLRHPNADELILAVEVADSSVRIDLTRKAQLYAASGTPEYWVADIARQRILVHRQPSPDGYKLVRVFGAEEAISLEGHASQVMVGDLLRLD